MNKSNLHLKIQLKALIEHGDEYCVSWATLRKKLELPTNALWLLANSMGYNIFIYEGVRYVGCNKRKHEYYYDKLLGQNPFYQTS